MVRSLAVLVCLGLFTAACGGGRTGPATTGGIGDPVTDGQFTFTVTDWECGAREVSRGVFTATAVGRFCLLSLTVENTGEAGRRFAAANQRLFDDEGRTYEVALQETLLMNAGDIGAELNPGLSIDVLLIFDVSDPFAITEVELHDALLSRGARVSLSG